MTQVAQADTLLSDYESDWAPLESGAAGGGADSAGGDGALRRGRARAWLNDLRRAALDRFIETGFPSNRLEAWRQTNVAPMVKNRFHLPSNQLRDAGACGFEQFTLGEEAITELVFVNGHYVPQLSRLGKLPRGARVCTLAEALESDESPLERHLSRFADVEANPFVALNTAFIRDGVLVHLPSNTALERPVHLLFITAPGLEASVTHPRLLVVAGENVEATLVESYASASGGTYFTNAVTEIIAGRGSRIDHCKLQQESLSSLHVATMQVDLARDARFVSHSVTLGAKLARNDLNVIMNGERADATLNGLVLIGAGQHADNHTLLDHAMPGCPSHELYKHVLSDKSSAVFHGKILVRPDAQKTDSKQTSKALLLSDDAVMNSQPALEIYADDVKCTHGSTIGPVDEEMVFYLRSRGIELQAARHLLSYAFAADITRRIRVEPVRRRVEEILARRHGLPRDLRITDLGRHDEASR